MGSQRVGLDRLSIAYLLVFRKLHEIYKKLSQQKLAMTSVFLEDITEEDSREKSVPQERMVLIT